MAKIKGKDLALLDKLEDYQNTHGYPPTVREVAKLAGTPSTSVAKYYLDRLVRFGLIEREPRISRGIILVGKMPVAPDGKNNAAPRLPLAKRRMKAGIALAGATVRRGWRMPSPLGKVPAGPF